MPNQEAQRRAYCIRNDRELVEIYSDGGFFGDQRQPPWIAGNVCRRNGRGPMGCKKIVTHRNASGVTMRGRKFNVSNNQDLWKSITYSGAYRYGVWDTRNKIMRGEAEWQIIEHRRLQHRKLAAYIEPQTRPALR